MKAALLTAALALAAAAPLAAQEALSSHQTEATAPEYDREVEPGNIVILEASERVRALYASDAALDPESKLCLKRGETAMLASGRVVFELAGKGCYRVGKEEERAAFKQQLIIAPPVPERGPDPGFDRRWATQRRALASARPILLRVASGSPSVLRRIPVSTLIGPGLSVCLAGGEQLSIAASNGQQTTYRGPGCMRRNGPPSRDNIGGLTFG